nr:hypothetical protein [Bacteriovoracaceae bacterium]
DHQSSIKSILDQMAKQQKEKADLLADTQADKDKVNKIDALNKEIADGHQALNLKRQERQTKVNAILTPEQRIQMEKNKMARKGHRREMIKERMEERRGKKKQASSNPHPASQE